MELFSTVISLTVVGALAWALRRMRRKGEPRRSNVPEHFFGTAGDDTLIAESRSDKPGRLY